MLSVSRLRILREVADRESFSAAAEALSYTQSAVSQAVARLEAEAGVALLERDSHGVRPTGAGVTLLDHARRILAELDVAETELGAIADGTGGELRLASFPTAGATLIPLAVAAFTSAHPDVVLSLTEGEPEEIAPRLRDGEFDLALLFVFEGGDGSQDAGLRSDVLFDDPMRLALPAGHPLTKRDRIRLKDLADEAWVQTSNASECARHVVSTCRAAGFEPRTAFESDDYLTVQGLVAAGVGVALIPSLALSPGLRYDIAIRDLYPDVPSRRVVAASRRGASALPAAAAMLDILREQAGSLPPLVG